MSEYDWRDGSPVYRSESKPDRYRIVAVIGGVRFTSEETYEYADVMEKILDVNRDVDGYVAAVRVQRGARFGE